MNDNQGKQNSLVDTTDCLEAVGVFRGWKNFLFVIIILGLLLLQASFWAVQTGYVKPACDTPAVGAEGAESTKLIKKAAEKVTTDPNQPTEAAPQQSRSLFSLKFKHLRGGIQFVNFVLILTAILYCLIMLFSLKVSLLGRLGGINHIARAFFLSLAFVVLLLPWQRFFAGVVVGAIFTPAELQSRCVAAEGYDIFHTTLHYLRFTGYWLLVLLLLIFSQWRSSRWAKAILRRLEVI